MPHCTATLISFHCVQSRDPEGDRFFLRWSFRLAGSRETFYRRPQSGYWSLVTGASEALNEQVVDQSIFANRPYELEVELWTDDSGLSFTERMVGRMKHLMKRWGLLSLIPGAGAVAFVAALFGAGTQGVFMGSLTYPILVNPGPPPVGVGTFGGAATGSAGGSSATVPFTVVTR